MIWEGELLRRAEANGDVAKFGLEKVYRSADPKVLALAAALRREDFDAAWPLVQQFAKTTVDASFVDVVHDNLEVYPIAREKFAAQTPQMLPKKEERREERVVRRRRPRVDWRRTCGTPNGSRCAGDGATCSPR